MTLQARPLRPGDGRAMGDLLLAASLRDQPEWRQGRLYGDSGTLVLDGAGHVVAGIMSVTETVWIHGQPAVSPQPVAAGVRPGAPLAAMQACRTGLADDWRQHGAGMVFKWGLVHDSLNELLGFSPVMLGWEFSLRFPAGGPAATGVRQAGIRDLPAIAELYRLRGQDHAGVVVRTLPDWQETFWPLLMDGQSHLVLVAEMAGEIEGYLAIRPGSPTDEPGVTVTEWVDRTPRAFQCLWQALQRLAGDRLRVTLPPLPPDRPIEHLLPDDVTMRPIRSLLVRPGPPDAFWPHVRCRPGQGRLRFGVRDPLALWPGHVTLTWQDGRPASWGDATEADVHVDVGTLGLLAFGATSVADARRLGLLQGDDESLAVLDGLFTTQPIYRYPADNRVNRRFRQW